MKLELVGKFYDNHSLSIINRNLALKFKELGVTFCITALDQYNPDSGLLKEDVKTLKELEKVEFEEIDVQLRHSYPPIWQWPVSDNTKVVYIQPWEFEKALFEWQYKFETFADALIVPSNYIANVFRSGGLKPSNLFTIPNGLDETIYNKDEPTDLHPLVDPEEFNFVYVGNSQWRKGLDILANAWGKTFKKYDKATLIIKDNPRIYGKNNILNEVTKMRYKTGCSRIVYIDDELSQEQMASIFKASKVVVHPYRAEGFGMHVQEAVACGCLPLISANGPTDDFIPEDIGLRINVDRQSMNIQDSGVFAMKPGDASTLMSTHTFFNEPQSDDLVNKMRFIYHSHNRDGQFFDKLNEFELDNTWNKVAKEYLSVLTDVNNRPSTVRG